MTGFRAKFGTKFRTLQFAVLCGLLGALAAWLGLKLFPTSAGFIAAAGGRALVVWMAFFMLALLSGLWFASGHRKTSLLEGIGLAFLALLLAGTLSLVLFRADVGAWSLGWALSWDLFLRSWWLLVGMGALGHALKIVFQRF